MRHGLTKTELAIVVAIIGAMLLVLYPAIQSSRNPKGPHGETYPSSPPDEANRIVHPTGLSIVAPENWDQVSDMGRDIPFLRVAARGAPGRRLKSIIMVSQCGTDPDEAVLAACTKITFQGTEAYEACTVTREDSFDDPARSNYVLYFERNGTWWQINFLVADRMTQLPDSIRQYIETIRLPNPE